MKRFFFVVILLLGAVALLAGCSRDNSTSDSSESIADEFGGFLPTDESAAFGDETIAAEMTDSPEFNDPMLDDGNIDDAINASGAHRYALRIVWGQLRFDSTVSELTDWSGSLTVSRGVEILRRVIKFETGQDYIVVRTDPAKIQWVSETSSHYDGIFVNIIIPPDDEEAADDTPVTLTFDTGPLNITFDISDLPRLDTICYVEDSNAVAFHSFRTDEDLCPKGFLAGFWGMDEESQQVFFGSWMSITNELMGHINGIWGVDNNGNQDNVFYGKYIDTEGNFKGLLKGTYWFNGNPFSHYPSQRGGWFRGHFYDANGVILGVMGGRFKEIPRNAGMGFFQGRWRYYCDGLAAINDGLDD